MVVNVPANIETLQQCDLSSPVSDVFPSSDTTKPLDIHKSSPQQVPPPQAPASESSDCETASTRSRSSSTASSVESYSTPATSACGDNEVPVKKPLVRPSRPGCLSPRYASRSPSTSDRSESNRVSVPSRRSSSASSSSPSFSSTTASSRRSSGVGITLAPLPAPLPTPLRAPLPAPLPAPPSSDKAIRTPLDEDHSNKSSIASPPPIDPRAAASSDNSPQSSTSRSDDVNQAIIVSSGDKPKLQSDSVIDRSPKRRPTSFAELNDARLTMIRDNAAAGIWPLDYAPPSPCEVEPPSSARRSDFGDDQTSNAPLPALGPSVEPLIFQSSVIPPEVVSKEDLPAKMVRWDTRRYSSGGI